jgi:hypothetical protein
MLSLEVQSNSHFVLSRLVTLQSVILDTEDSLSDIVREIHKALEGDIAGGLVSFALLDHFLFCLRLLFFAFAPL